MSFDVKVEAQGAMQKTRMLKNIPMATRYQLTRFGSEFERYLKDVSVKGRYVGKYRSGRRTGALRRSITHSVKLLRGQYQLEVGTKGSPYARILEKGGTIHAKGKLLTIPLKGTKGTARQQEGAFFVTSKKGNLLLARKKGKKGIKPLFVLKEKVRIPAKRWLSKSFGDRKGKLDRMMKKSEVLKIAARMR